MPNGSYPASRSHSSYGFFGFLSAGVCAAPPRLKENALAGSTGASDLSSLSSSFVLATWHEAREESTGDQRGIFHTVVNREAKCGWWDTDAVGVGLKPSQLSCFDHCAE
jgi:hypothetical protein